MANNTNELSLKTLIQASIKVWNGMLSIGGVCGDTPYANNIDNLQENYNNCYATNNSVVCFVHDYQVYVTPMNLSKLHSLAELGFREEMFFVPFSNGDYPKECERRWKSLVMMNTASS